MGFGYLNYTPSNRVFGALGSNSVITLGFTLSVPSISGDHIRSMRVFRVGNPIGMAAKQRALDVYSFMRGIFAASCSGNCGYFSDVFGNNL